MLKLTRNNQMSDFYRSKTPGLAPVLQSMDYLNHRPVVDHIAGAISE